MHPEDLSENAHTHTQDVELLKEIGVKRKDAHESRDFHLDHRRDEEN